MGVAVDQQTSDAAMARLGIDGVLIIGVQPGSGAEAAGLRGSKWVGNQLLLGDIIQEVNGRKVKSMDDLLNAIDSHKVGDVVDLNIFREGQAASVQVTLQ